MKRLFQYCILFHEYETTDGNKKYVDTRIVRELTTVLAKDEKAVVFQATRVVPEKEAETPECVEILVRPF